MALGMPSINIIFKQLAATAITRSSRGILALVVKDDTKNTATTATYSTYLTIPENAYTEENMTMIRQAFTGGPAKVIIIKQSADGSTADLAKTLDQLSFNWLAVASGTAADQEAAVAYVQNRNKTKQGKKVKALVYGVKTADDMHIVRFSTEKVIMDGVEVAGWQLLARLGGILAGLPMTRSATYYTLADVNWAQEPADLDKAVDGGNLFLFKMRGSLGFPAL